MDEVNEVVCEVVNGAIAAKVTVVESATGAGDWSVKAVQLAVTDGSALTAERLRNFGWAGVIAAARVRAKAQKRSVVLSRPSDPPAAFRVSRQGRAKRTEVDYANLAASYLALPADLRRPQAAAVYWHERFGRQPGRWRADIATAMKRYVERDIDGDRLTSEGMALVHGEGIAAILAAEVTADRAELDLALLDGAAAVRDGRITESMLRSFDRRVARRAQEAGVSEADYRVGWRRQAEMLAADFGA